MVVGIIIAWIVGMVMGRFLRDPKPVCPAEVLGYTCKYDTGRDCDHRESAVLQAQANIAKWREDNAEKADNGAN